jgi:hypothetical protein
VIAPGQTKRFGSDNRFGESDTEDYEQEEGGEADDNFSFKWDGEKKQDVISIENANLNAINTEEEIGVVIGDTLIPKEGIVRYSIEVKDVGKGIQIGFVAESAKPEEVDCHDYLAAINEDG